jgi:hypothetical protein
MDASTYAGIDIFYPDVRADDPPTGSPHLRVFTDLVEERQVTLGGIGGRRYRVFGLVTVQIFTPFGGGQKKSDEISGVVKGAFRGVNTGGDAIEFRNVRVVDVGQAGAWLQTNVLAEFNYDEFA